MPRFETEVDIDWDDYLNECSRSDRKMLYEALNDEFYDGDIIEVKFDKNYIDQSLKCIFKEIIDNKSLFDSTSMDDFREYVMHTLLETIPGIKAANAL